MTVKECYEKMGANYENVLSRLGGSEALVKRLVLKFLDDASYQKLEEQLLNKNVEEAFRAAHTLKGVCLNLGFDSALITNTGILSNSSDSFMNCKTA